MNNLEKLTLLTYKQIMLMERLHLVLNISTDMEELHLLTSTLTSNKKTMKIKFLKIFFVLALSTSVLTSCVGEDDYSIPRVVEYALSEGFNGITPGSGSTEIPVELTGWVNHNETGTRLWAGKTFSNNNFAEFSTF